MIPEFEPLREDEIEVVVKAPVYVAILIAGADGNIDKSERKEAINIARKRLWVMFASFLAGYAADFGAGLCAWNCTGLRLVVER